MKGILAYIRRKLSVRVSLWVVFFAAIIFNVALGFLFYQSREAVRQEAVSRATQILDKTSLRVDSILNRVEVASNMTKSISRTRAATSRPTPSISATPSAPCRAAATTTSTSL